MMTGPAVGPAMLLTVLMRWPSLIVIGAASVGGTLIYRELDDRYELTEQLQAYYNGPRQKEKAGEHPRHGEMMLVRTPTKVVPAPHGAVIPTYPMPPQPEAAEEVEATTQQPPVKKPVEDPAEPPPVQVATALALDKPSASDQPVNYAVKQYVVQRGDSLSKIVSKLGVPPPKRNELMQSLFVGNQRAFMNMDPDKLNEGTVLNIPQMASK